MSAFDAPGTLALAELPAGLVTASTTVGRPLLAAGRQPIAAAVLLDFDARSVAPPPPALLPDTQAVVDAFTTKPDADTQKAMNRLVGDLISAAVWADLGYLHVGVIHDSQASRINWRDPAGVAALPVNVPTFTAWRGWNSDGVSAHLDTQIAFTAIPGVAQDDAHISAFAFFGSTNGYILGQIGALRADLGRSLASMGSRLNTGTRTVADAMSAGGSGVHHIAVSRTAAGAEARYLNGVAGTASALASAAPSASNLALLRASTFYAPTALVLRAATAGKGLTAAKHLALYNALRTYCATFGAA